MPYYIGDVIKDHNHLVARTPERFRESGIDVRLQTRVDDIDAAEKVVRLSDGTILAYDILVLGTGTTPFVPAIPGIDLEGVFTLKKLSDALRIKSYLKEKQCRKALIVGAGFIGQNIYLFCASEGLNAWFYGTDRAGLAKALDLRPGQRVLYGQAVGYPKKK